MLTLSIPTQNHFGSPTLSPAGSPTSSASRPSLTPALRPPTLMNPAAPSRRSMMPSQGCVKRPKLSLQTSILPQPVSPALPLPCSADTPTSRNTLANSFRSPGPEKQSQTPHVQQTFGRAESMQQQVVGKENTPLPYSVECAERGILKNTPLAKLIRSRRLEKKKRNISGTGTAIKFVDEPQLIPRPPQDSEADMMDVDEEEPAAPSSESVSTPAPSNVKPTGTAEWSRLRTQRSANEGRELRRGSSTPMTATSSNGPAPASPAASDDSSDFLPPQTPETPSPAQTRDWVWTLGDDFHAKGASQNNGSWTPYTPPDSGDNSRRSSNAETGLPGSLPLSVPVPTRQQLGSAIKTIPCMGGAPRLPDTPDSATERQTKTRN